MAHEPLRLAIIGLGRMGRFHAEGLADLVDISVSALVDPDAKALAVAQQLHPDAVATDDLVEGMAVADAVLIASPTPLHPGVTETALEAGLHVLCEKPLSLDPVESARLGQIARDAGCVLQVGFWRRFSAPWATARKAIADGRIGSPVLLRLSQWDANPPPPEFCDPAVSGGLAVDCGVHELDLAEWLTARRIIELRYQELPLVDEGVGAAGDVDNLLMIGELDDGAAVVIDLSRNARYEDDVRTEVLGSEGAILIETLPTGRARIGTSDGMLELAGSACDDAMRDGVRAQAMAFAAAIRGEPVDYPDADASARAVSLAIQASGVSRL